MATSLLAGFALGFSLILAIGAQNAFVLKQGLARQHVLLVCLLCATSDALLIALGVWGFAEVVQAFPQVETFARWGGAAFLFCYALLSWRAALRHRALTPDEQPAAPAMQTALICLAFTWLNPHVYLDTLVLLGSVSTQVAAPWGFGIGAMCASFVFFFALGYGARLLTPLFRKPRAWQVLDVLIGAVMFTIALSFL